MAVTNFQGALRTFLLADTGIAALIDARLHPPPAPQESAMPYLTFQRISEDESDGRSLGKKSDIVVERWQFGIYADGVDSAEEVKTALRDALNFLAYTTLSGYKVFYAWRESGVEGFEPENDGSEEGYNKITQDYFIKRKIETE